MDNAYEAEPEMDHSMHGMNMGGMNHGGMDMGHMMAMNFHAKHKGVIYLFESAKIETHLHLWLYVVFTLALGILVEFIKVYRFKLAMVGPGTRKRSAHLFDSVLYFAQTTIGYCLMLVAMTFHYALFIAVVLGMAVGYFLFNGKSDDNEEFQEMARRESIKGDCC